MELLRVKFDEQARSEKRRSASTALEGQPVGNLKPWREVVTPHSDVAKGNCQNAEFAADLWQVYEGGGADEYRDPAEFFRRNFLTQSLTGLRGGALQRLGKMRAIRWCSSRRISAAARRTRCWRSTIFSPGARWRICRGWKVWCRLPACSFHGGQPGWLHHSEVCGAGFQPAPATAGSQDGCTTAEPPKPKRFHGTAQLDPQRVGRDAGTIAQKVISHLAGIIGADVKVTIEIDAFIPTGASEQVAPS